MCRPAGDEPVRTDLPRGFGGTVVIDQIAGLPAWVERLGPLVVALAIVVAGRRRD